MAEVRGCDRAGKAAQDRESANKAPQIRPAPASHSSAQEILWQGGHSSAHLPTAVLQEDVDALCVLEVVGELDDVLVVQVPVQLNLIGDLKGSSGPS